MLEILGERREKAHITLGNLSSPPLQAESAGLTPAHVETWDFQAEESWGGMETHGSLWNHRLFKGFCSPPCMSVCERVRLLGSLGTDSFLEVAVYSRRFAFGIIWPESFGAQSCTEEHVRKPQNIVSLCGNNLQGAWTAVTVHCCSLYVWLCINSSICLLWLPWLLNTYTQGHFGIVQNRVLEPAP